MTIQLEGQCDQATLSENIDPFKAALPLTYFLRESPPEVVIYNPGNLVTSNLLTNCGALELFIENDDGTPLDTAVFEDDRPATGAYFFIIGQGPLTDVTKAGDYNL